MKMKLNSPFDLSGLAALSVFKTQAWKDLFSILEREQAVFIKESTRFRSVDYKWPRDPLHTWSRCWEYPYVYHHILKWMESRAGLPTPKIVDVGSGVTFFPFKVARLGCDVSCTDVDIVCEKELESVSKVFPSVPGHLDFRLADGDKLPYADAEIDAVYCISVLEHIPRFELAIEEMSRILKPGGALFLTIDIDLRGDCEIGAERYKSLKEAIDKHFDYIAPVRTVHPSDLLTSANGPYHVHEPDGVRRLWFLLKQEIKQLLGRRRLPLTPFYLCVEGLTMSRKM